MFDYASPPPFAPSPDAGTQPPTPVMQPAMPGGGMPAPGMNGIPGATGTPPTNYPTLPGPIDPAKLNYIAETQSDGTVLLRLQGPDGAPGPVVQIVKPSAPKGAKHGGHGK